MNSVKNEIVDLEEQLRQADLKPNPEVFERLLDDQMVLMIDGETCSPKAHIVAMHHPDKAQKFDRIDMSDIKFVDHGDSVVVTCVGNYEGPAGKFSMNFLRVWIKTDSGWKIAAGAMTQPKI